MVGQRIGVADGGGRPHGRQWEREDEAGHWGDKSAEAVWCFDGQQRPTVWSCENPREEINPIRAQIPMLADCVRRTDIGTQDEDRGAQLT
jgi:hypothetical protein